MSTETRYRSLNSRNNQGKAGTLLVFAGYKDPDVVVALQGVRARSLNVEQHYTNKDHDSEPHYASLPGAGHCIHYAFAACQQLIPGRELGT